MSYIPGVATKIRKVKATTNKSKSKNEDLDNEEYNQVAIYGSDVPKDSDMTEDDDDVEETEDTDADDSFSKKRKRKATAKIIELPGGTGRRQCSNAFGFSVTDELPRSVASAIHDYLDTVLGPILWYRYESFYNMIPICVDSILSHNRIYFSSITINEAPYSVEMFEPIWYHIDVRRNALSLFYSKLHMHEFTTNSSSNTNVPVYHGTGQLSLEKFDPPYVHERVIDCDIGPAVINCLVLCDHVSQHIINEILCPMTKMQSIHDPQWNKVGCTLHSFLELTIIKDSTPEPQTSNTNVDLSRLVSGLNSVSSVLQQQQQQQHLQGYPQQFTY